jgi:hypothetical protein
MRRNPLDAGEHVFDTGWVDRQLVEHAPDKWRGELDGLHIRHDGDPIPITVRVQWTDGTEGEVNAWTSQWTCTHVHVALETAPPFHGFWGASFRYRAA